MAVYTDIAAELYPESRGSVPRGVKTFTATASGIGLTRVEIERSGLRRDGRWERAAERAEDLEGAPPPIASEHCPYVTNCTHRLDRCMTADPALLPAGDERAVACFLHDPRFAAQIQENHKPTPTGVSA